MPPKIKQNIAFTAEQFEELVNRLTFANREQTRTELNVTPPVTHLVAKNFTKCTSRFNSNEIADVEAFLDAVITYKESANLSDDNALWGLGIAATWWKGIKNSFAD